MIPPLEEFQIPEGVPLGKFRKAFEESVQGKPLRMTAIESEGTFIGYRDSHTHAMWIGFVMGRTGAAELAQNAFDTATEAAAARIERIGDYGAESKAYDIRTDSWDAWEAFKKEHLS